MKKGIKFSGHTMGAPKCDIYQSIDLFKTIGYDGIEVRVADNGQIDSETITNAEAEKIGQYAADKGMNSPALLPTTRTSAATSAKALSQTSSALPRSHRSSTAASSAFTAALKHTPSRTSGSTTYGPRPSPVSKKLPSTQHRSASAYASKLTSARLP